MTADQFRCSLAARQRCDALAGTAAPATGWLLVENNGKWAKRAFEDAADPVAGRAIAARAAQARLRPLMVRRTGPRRRRHHHAFAVVDSSKEAVSWGSYTHLADLLEHDWVTRAPVTDPMYLVCTHGTHDRCCAIAGRPVAAALAELRPEHTWECSHVGGDRFAGNVLVLPYGLYYGYVDASDVAAIVTATERGELHLPLFRGRSCDPAPVQTARIAAQRELGRPGIDALGLVSHRFAGHQWHVSFQAPDVTVMATVEQHRTGSARATCAHAEPVPMRELRVVDLVTTPG